MTRTTLINRVREMTRDFTNSIFRESDIIDFLNESINRTKQVIFELDDMDYLITSSQEPNILPEKYHHLLAVYAVSRCFGQDERHYQATTFMNEFESKLEELKGAIEDGKLILLNSTGEVITTSYTPDYVDKDVYFSPYGAITELSEPDPEF